MRKRLRIVRISSMKKLLTIIVAISAIMTGIAQAEPEVRKAIPVNRQASMPGEPQVRRAIPVKPSVIAAEMRDASVAAITHADDASTSAQPAPTYRPVEVKETAAKHDGGGFSVAVFLLLTAYFFPSICAFVGRHPNASAILILNLFLGWTLLGWVGALVWAATKSIPINRKA